MNPSFIGSSSDIKRRFGVRIDYRVSGDEAIEIIRKFGEEAETAMGHVSKFGELTGGAEHPVDQLGQAAARAAANLDSILSSISAGKPNATTGAITGALNLLGIDTTKKAIDDLQNTKPIVVNVTDNGSAAAVQQNINNITGKTVYVDVYERHHSDSSDSQNTPKTNFFGLPRAAGTIGLAKAQGTLMGELGPELVVSNGRYFVVGQNGPEMFDLADDAIVFNHLQTKSLLEKGTSPGRGKAITSERNAVSYAKGNVNGGPAKASASAALDALKQLRAQWQALKDLSVKDLAGKGGGGGGGDPKAFIKDLEKWYNWLQQIAQLEKEINYEEALRNRIASDYNKDGLKYYQSQRKSIKDLTNEIKTQQSLLASQEEYFVKRQGELNKQSAFSSLYGFGDSGQLYYQQGIYRNGKTAFEWLSDLVGRNVTTGEANYTAKEQYEELISAGFGFAMKYDSSGNEIKQEGDDWYNTAIQAFWDKIESDKEEMQSLHDSIEDLRNNVESNQQKQNEILKAIEDNQISVENRILDAIVDLKERHIQEMRDERDAIEKTNSDLLNGLSNALSKERQLYENGENSKELTSLQRQLGILQRSGGSAAEISSLQQEIASKQQDMYFDTQQQQIDALQEASDKQLERLDRQIELEEEALEYQKANGLLWDQVYEVMAGTPDEITQFITDNNSEFWNKSEVSFGQESRQIHFEAEQWKAFSEEGDITTLLGSIEEEVTRETKEREAAEAAAAEATAEKAKEPAQNNTNDGGGKDQGTKDEDKKSEIKTGTKRYKVTTTDINGQTQDYYFDTAEQASSFRNSAQTGFGSSANAGLRVSGITDLVAEKNAKKIQKLQSNEALNVQKVFQDVLVKGINGMKKQLEDKPNYTYDEGGVVNSDQYALVHAKESVLTPEQTRILRNEILGSNRNSLMNLLLDFRAAYAGMGETINTSINNSSPIIIEHAEVNMRVDQLANGYDSARAADDVMKEMLSIARKTNAQNRIGR